MIKIIVIIIIVMIIWHSKLNKLALHSKYIFQCWVA